LTEAILHRLGSTPDQIDHERERVHADLFGPGREGRLRSRVPPEA
jgi:hypothetical protein